VGLRQDRERHILAHATLRHRVMQERGLGLSYPAIATRCGISVTTVRHLVRQSEALGEIVSKQRRDRLDTYEKPTRDAERQQMALDLRIEGFDVVDIAQHLDLPVSLIQEYLFDALQTRVSEEAKQTETSRYLSLARFDELTSMLFPAAMNGNMGAVDRLLKIEESRAKLLGTNTPIRVDIEQDVREMAKKLGLDPDAAVLEVEAIVKQNRQMSA
jgi:AcrR family transcriptional regulator